MTLQHDNISGQGYPTGQGLVRPASMVTWPAVERRRNFVGGRPANGLYTLRAFIGLIARRKGALLFTFLLIFGAACAISLMMPKRYEAESKLIVKRTRAEVPVTLEGGAAPAGDLSESEVNAEIELLHSRDLLEEVLAGCHLAPDTVSSPEERRELIALGVQDLEKNLKIASIGKTNLISVRYSSADPARAADVVNTLVDLYLRKHVAIHRNRDASSFFSAQLSACQKELADAQTELAQFLARDNASLLPDQKEATLRRTSDLEASIQQTDSDIRDAENRSKLLRQQIAALPATIETASHTAKDTSLIERLKGDLLTLQNQRTGLLTKYAPGYRLVQEVDRQIRDTQAALDREQNPTVVDRTHAPNPLRQSIEGDLLRAEAAVTGLRARRASLAQDLAQYRARMQRFDGVTAQYDDLQRRVRIAEDNYVLFQKKDEESRLEDALDQKRILNVTIVDKAVAPVMPAERYRGLILALGFLVACFGSVAVALTIDYFSQPPEIVPVGASSSLAAILPGAAPRAGAPGRRTTPIVRTTPVSARMAPLGMNTGGTPPPARTGTADSGASVRRLFY